MEPRRHFLSTFRPWRALQTCLNLLVCLWNYSFSDTVGRSQQPLKTTWLGNTPYCKKRSCCSAALFQSTGSRTMDQAPPKGCMCELPYRQHRADERSALLNLFLLDPRSAFSPPRSRLCMAILQPELLRQWQLSGPDVATFALLPIGCFTLMEIP